MNSIIIFQIPGLAWNLVRVHCLSLYATFMSTVGPTTTLDMKHPMWLFKGQTRMQQTQQYHETNGFAHPHTLTILADVVRTKKHMNAHRIIELHRNICSTSTYLALCLSLRGDLTENLVPHCSAHRIAQTFCPLPPHSCVSCLEPCLTSREKEPDVSSCKKWTQQLSQTLEAWRPPAITITINYILF